VLDFRLPLRITFGRSTAATPRVTADVEEGGGSRITALANNNKSGLNTISQWGIDTMEARHPTSSAQRETEAQGELSDVAADYAEAALDALHVDDLLGHIPIVRTALAAAKVIGSVRDHLLLRKIAIYLHAISAIPAAERRAMVERLTLDPAFKENVGEHLIELLDRVDGRRKPAMIGAVFTALAFDQITVKTLRRLNSAIQYLPAEEIDAVRALDTYNQTRSELARENRKPPDRESMQAIANAGLAEPDSLASGIWYNLNDTGTAFLRLELDRINPTS
jgi:hypothetical protein